MTLAEQLLLEATVDPSRSVWVDESPRLEALRQVAAANPDLMPNGQLVNSKSFVQGWLGLSGSGERGLAQGEAAIRKAFPGAEEVFRGKLRMRYGGASTIAYFRTEAGLLFVGPARIGGGFGIFASDERDLTSRVQRSVGLKARAKACLEDGGFSPSEIASVLR